MSVRDYEAPTICPGCDEPVDVNSPCTIFDERGAFHGYVCLSIYEENNDTEPPEEVVETVRGMSQDIKAEWLGGYEDLSP